MARKLSSRAAIERIDRLLREKVERTPRSDLIPIIKEMTSDQSNPTVVAHLRQRLRHEYLARNDFDAATAILLEEIEHRPHAPMPLLTLAEQLHFHEGRPGEAVAVATKSLGLADEAKEFRRHARAVLLRSASEIGDVELVRKCLREIIELDLQRDEIDVGKEEDLLERARKLAIEQELLDRYQAFLETP